MKMNNHTPGPWHVGGRDNSIIYASDGYAVANAETYHNKHPDQQQANSSLIAASPELLADLESFVELCEPRGLFPKLAARAKVTIAKAKGC